MQQKSGKVKTSEHKDGGFGIAVYHGMGIVRVRASLILCLLQTCRRAWDRGSVTSQLTTIGKVQTGQLTVDYNPFFFNLIMPVISLPT